MSRKMKVLVAVLAAILVLAVGSTAVVMAQEEEPPPTPETEANGFLPRVAEILGISQEELTSAFQQAQQEMRQETFLRFLDRAVEEGRIAPEKADEFLEWWEQRPEVCDRLMQRMRIFNAIRSRQMLQQGPEAAKGLSLRAHIRQATHERQMQQQGVLPMRGGPATPPWLAK